MTYSKYKVDSKYRQTAEHEWMCPGKLATKRASQYRRKGMHKELKLRHKSTIGSCGEIWSLLFRIWVNTVYFNNGRTFGQISGDNDLQKITVNLHTG
jgi:hypothetical protein